MEIANDITSLVGNTPLVKLNRIRKYFDCYPEIIAKLETVSYTHLTLPTNACV